MIGHRKKIDLGGNKEGLVWNLAFGVEDSLVSTVGLLSGVAAAGVSKSVLFLTGTVLIFVEAFSMGVGSYVADSARKEVKKNNGSQKSSLPGAAIMLFSYLLAGLIPLSPYLLFEDGSSFWSIIFSLASLLGLGLLLGFINKVNPWKEALRTGTLGGLAVLIGVVVGKYVGIH